MLAKSLPPTRRTRLFSWPAVAVVLLLIQAVLAVTVPKSVILTAYSVITFFLVLVLAAGIATLNAVHSREAIRLFWSFLAMAFGVWSINPWSSIYYLVVQNRDRPVYLVALVPLFLHIVLMIAAVVSSPHVKISPHRRYRTTLNFLLLLFFWIFAYSLLLVPYSDAYWNAVPFLRGEALYLAENCFLLVALGVLIVRAQPPWKSIYWHLLAASTLYALGSLIANLLVAFRGYYSGLQDIPYTAAAYWFVWATLRGRNLAPQLAQSVQPDTGDTKYASLLAMASVLAVPVVGVWELFRVDEPYRTRVIRLLIVLLSVLLLGVFVFVKEYLANRELSSDVGVANERLRLALESGRAVGWEWDLKSGRHFWFGDLKTMFGIPSDTFVGGLEDFYRYVHSKDRQQVSEAVTDARKNHRPFAAEFRIVWPDGMVRWVHAEGKFHYSSSGQPERMLGMAHDVTDRKRAEEAQRESEERFRLVADTAPVLIWMAGTDKLCTFFNHGWLNFTGRSLEQELGEGWAAGVHPDDVQRCLETHCASFDARAEFEIEYRLRRFDGEYRWVVDYGVPRFETDGTFCGYIGSCVDITERKSSEESLQNLSGRLIRAQEEERARIARELHDDFSQRLALLGISLGQLSKELPESEVEERTRLLEMMKGTEEMSSDLHSLSHQLHSSKLELVGLVPAINGLCKEIGEKYNIEIHFAKRGPLPKITKNVELCLFRVAQEALGNVVKHSLARSAQVELGANSMGVSLRIADAGSGFEPDLSNPAAGIGLVGMRERLRLVGGRLSVKSELMCGTEILAEVPLASTTGQDASNQKHHKAGA